MAPSQIQIIKNMDMFCVKIEIFENPRIAVAKETTQIDRIIEKMTNYDYPQ